MLRVLASDRWVAGYAGPFWASVCSWHRCRYISLKVFSFVGRIVNGATKDIDFDLINPGNFLTLKQGDYTIYSEGVSADDGVLSNIFIFEKTRIKDEIAFWAERGEIVVNEEAKTRFLRLQKGVRYQGNPGQADYQVIEFESYDQEITFGETESRRFDVAGKDFFKLAILRRKLENFIGE